MRIIPKKLFLFSVIIILAFSIGYAQADYGFYHMRIIDAEKEISQENFEAGLAILDSLFQDYDFVFLKDYKVAAQLAILVNKKDKANAYLTLALKNGWTKKEIRKNKLLKPLVKDVSKANLKRYNQSYLVRLDIQLKNQVHALFKKDQKMAIKNLFKIGQKAKVRYTENKFAPHSEQQLARLEQIIKKEGYPGEKLIGNNFWASTILSHHNSISANYNKQDSLYPRLKPLLLFSIKNGTMSPQEYALIDNWKIASQSDHEESSYGFLGPMLNRQTLSKTNHLRQNIGLRSIEIRNDLVKIQDKWKIDFYLAGKPWQNGAIEIINRLE